MTAYSQPCQGWTINSSSSASLQALFQIVAASFFLALCSQIKIVLPFSPIPLTLQTLAVLLIGASLGSRKGALVILVYFAEILMGLPVLAGGIIDPLVFIGPKGGYYLGFCIQAYCIGWFVEREMWTRSASVLIGGLIGVTLQLGLGALMLASYIGSNHVWMMGVAPFIPGEILKVLFVCFFARPHQVQLNSSNASFE